MKIIKRILLCCFFVLWAGMGSAQFVPSPLDSILNKTLDSMQVVLNVKSLSAAMQFPDSAVWARATGISSIVPLDSVTISDVYLIGSVTKTITAACILQLVDQGLLNLDDSLYQWLDTIQYIDPNITIRQLLRHQSGIYDVLGNPACQPALQANPDSIWDPKDLITTFIQPAIFQPGTNWSYSNTNYFLLGMVIKEVTGNPFYQEYRSRFFTTLGMNTIAIPAYETVTSPVAHVWIDLNSDGITDDAHNFYFNYLALNSAGGSAGGYYATPSDITRWMRTYMRGDLVSSGLMTQAKTTVNAPGLPGATYGLGLMKKAFIGYQGYGHGGDLGYAASSWYFPLKDLSITVFTNDSKNNSWTLVPVVTALLKSYLDYMGTITAVPNVENAELELVAYPNPFNDRLTAAVHSKNHTGKFELVLSNICGVKLAIAEQVKSVPGEQLFGFNNLESVSSGVYFISVFVEGKKIQTIKVIK